MRPGTPARHVKSPADDSRNPAYPNARTHLQEEAYPLTDDLEPQTFHGGDGRPERFRRPGRPGRLLRKHKSGTNVSTRYLRCLGHLSELHRGAQLLGTRHAIKYKNQYQYQYRGGQGGRKEGGWRWPRQRVTSLFAAPMPRVPNQKRPHGAGACVYSGLSAA